MKQDDLIKIVSGCINDIVFEYNGKPCGVTSEVENYVPTFQMWCGKDMKEYRDVQELINDKFFDSKSLSELLCAQNSMNYSVL
jgi:hypothetical protein